MKRLGHSPARCWATLKQFFGSLALGWFAAGTDDHLGAIAEKATVLEAEAKERGYFNEERWGGNKPKVLLLALFALSNPHMRLRCFARQTGCDDGNGVASRRCAWHLHRAECQRSRWTACAIPLLMPVRSLRLAKGFHFGAPLFSFHGFRLN